MYDYGGGGYHCVWVDEKDMDMLLTADSKADFKLNDETREWLLKKGDVLNFNGLEDFALLKDDTLLYATCTHEGYK